MIPTLMAGEDSYRPLMHLDATGRKGRVPARWLAELKAPFGRSDPPLNPEYFSLPPSPFGALLTTPAGQTNDMKISERGKLKHTCNIL